MRDHIGTYKKIENIFWLLLGRIGCTVKEPNFEDEGETESDYEDDELFRLAK